MAASEVVGTEHVSPAVAFSRRLDGSLDRQYRLASVILGDPLEAEDAVHDAALRAWRGFGHLRDHDRFDAWFGRILVNECRDRLRARRRRPVVTGIPILGGLDAGRRGEQAGATDVDLASSIADRDALDRGIDELDADLAVVVALRYGLDMTVPDIAARLGVPEGTVKSRLHRALGRLRTTIGPETEGRR